MLILKIDGVLIPNLTKIAAVAVVLAGSDLASRPTYAARSLQLLLVPITTLPSSSSSSMPPKPRSLHLPSGIKPRIPARKPHLSTLHLDAALRAQAHEMPSAPPFVPPAAPQIPPRRRPAFSPGGFGLTSKTAPRSDRLGLGRPPRPGTDEGTPSLREAAIARIAAADAAIKAQQGELEKVEGEGEAEACYVVSGDGRFKRAS